MATSVQITVIICLTIIALASLFVLMAWIGSKKQKGKGE